MAYKDLKVYELKGYQYNSVPTIILKGKWLQELGFDISTPITVKCEDGRLVITKLNDVW